MTDRDRRVKNKVSLPLSRQIKLISSFNLQAQIQKNYRKILINVRLKKFLLLKNK
jgi:hypothetical protein